jgi:hypothetical protein
MFESMSKSLRGAQPRSASLPGDFQSPIHRGFLTLGVASVEMGSGVDKVVDLLGKMKLPETEKKSINLGGV